MANLVRDLAAYNRVIKVGNDTITFTGQYAKNVSDADFALLTRNKGGEFVLGNAGEQADGALSPWVTAKQTAETNAANTAFTSNQNSFHN